MVRVHPDPPIFDKEIKSGRLLQKAKNLFGKIYNLSAIHLPPPIQTKPIGRILVVSSPDNKKHIYFSKHENKHPKTLTKEIVLWYPKI